MRTEQKLGEILVRLKVLSRYDLDCVVQAMQRVGRRQKFGQLARAMGLITEEHILAALTGKIALDHSGCRVAGASVASVPARRDGLIDSTARLVGSVPRPY